jgi:hypothetical protein
MSSNPTPPPGTYAPIDLAEWPLPTYQWFRSTDGTLLGTIDGNNPTFYVTVVCQKMNVMRNGQFLTQNFDYVAGPNAVTFLGAQVPQPGDILQVQGWPFSQ